MERLTVTTFVKMKRILPDVFLTILMVLDPSTILPCIFHIMRMSHFDLPGPRYAVAKAQNSNKLMVAVRYGHATQAKNIKMVKINPPPGTVTSLAW